MFLIKRTRFDDIQNEFWFIILLFRHHCHNTEKGNHYKEI